ncbi:MAG: hypothetical protein K6C69_07955 [Lachnospiraceae bacterium]|nr:hypothetical protein [Lachnospiraceae bacterium]
MASLLKGFYTKQDEQDRVLDFNEIISQRIDSVRTQMEESEVSADGFISGLDASVVGDLLDEEGNPVVLGSPLDALSTNVTGEGNEDTEGADLFSGMDEDGFHSGLSGNVIQVAPRGADPDAVRDLASNLMSDAKEKAQTILDEAMKEAEEIRNKAREEGYQEGYDSGYTQGSEKASGEYQELIDRANDQLQHLNEEFETKFNSMEKDMAETLCDVFSQVTCAISEQDKGVVIALANQVLNHIESTGEILLRVSKDDYSFVIENQGKLYLSANKDVNISVLEDPNLTSMQCVIETDAGVFDCSLDIQLEELCRQIKLLSCIS